MTGEVERDELIAQLRATGVKHNPDDILRIARLPDGKMVFLEIGNDISGCQHIMIQRIKLMADFDCYPLWDMDDGGDIDPTDLPLTEATIEHLLNWQKIYDGIIDWDDPASASFASGQEEIAFEREGISLWKQLQNELGDEYEIVYFSQSQHRVVSHLEEFEGIGIFQKAEIA